MDSVHTDDVADSVSATCWTVEEHAWKEVLPALPDEVSALLADPVVVSAQTTPAAPQRPAGTGAA